MWAGSRAAAGGRAAARRCVGSPAWLPRSTAARQGEPPMQPSHRTRSTSSCVSDAVDPLATSSAASSNSALSAWGGMGGRSMAGVPGEGQRKGGEKRAWFHGAVRPHVQAPLPSDAAADAGCCARRSTAACTPAHLRVVGHAVVGVGQVGHEGLRVAARQVGQRHLAAGVRASDGRSVAGSRCCRVVKGTGSSPIHPGKQASQWGSRHLCRPAAAHHAAAERGPRQRGGDLDGARGDAPTRGAVGGDHHQAERGHLRSAVGCRGCQSAMQDRSLARRGGGSSGATARPRHSAGMLPGVDGPAGRPPRPRSTRAPPARCRPPGSAAPGSS